MASYRRERWLGYGELQTEHAQLRACRGRTLRRNVPP